MMGDDEERSEPNSLRTPASGCLVCRSRKVKCDRTPRACLACRRLGVQCPGYGQSRSHISQDALESSVEGIFTASGIERRKLGSCDACYRSKTKCSKNRPTCRRCSQRGSTCIYSDRNRHKGYPEQQTASPRVALPESPETDGSTHAQQPTAADGGSNRRSESPARHPEEEHSILMRKPRISAQNIASERISGDHTLDWLFQKELPESTDRLRELFEAYFSRIHPLRCLGFIHQPSFMQAFDTGTLLAQYGKPLLLMLCAFGARCIFLDQDAADAATSQTDIPGKQWADDAADLVFQGLRRPSIQNLMAMVLVCEYGISADDHELVFQLIGCLYRLVRLLGLDNPRAESSPGDGQSQTRRESRNRLVWSCYVLDTMVAAGVSRNFSWPTSPTIPLPISDGDFMAQIPGQYASGPLSLESIKNMPAIPEMSIRGHSLYLIYLRSQVLCLIRQSSPDEVIQDPSSSFLRLIDELDRWYRSLPSQLHLTESSIYIHKETKVLGAVFYLHMGYHGAISDLTRVSLPGFNFPLAAAFAHVPEEFMTRCQERCLYHADETSRYIQMGLKHGKRPFDDLFCPISGFEATKIQMVHSAVVNPRDTEERLRAEANIRSNLKVMGLKGQTILSSHRAFAFPLLIRFGFQNVVAEWGAIDQATLTGEDCDVIGPKTMAYLTSSSTFRRAQMKVFARKRREQEQLDAQGKADASWTSQRVPPAIIGPMPESGPSAQSNNHTDLPRFACLEQPSGQQPTGTLFPVDGSLVGQTHTYMDELSPESFMHIADFSHELEWVGYDQWPEAASSFQF